MFVVGADLTEAVDRGFAGWRARPLLESAVLAAVHSSYTAAPLPAFAFEYLSYRLLLAGRSAIPPEHAPLAIDQLLEAAETSGACALDPGWSPHTTEQRGDLNGRLSGHQGFAYDPVMPEREVERWDTLLAPFAAQFREATGATLGGLVRVVNAFFARELAYALYAFQVPVPVSRKPDDLRAALEGIAVASPRPALPRDAALGFQRAELAEQAAVCDVELAAILKLLVTDVSEVSGRPFKRAIWQLRRKPVITVDDRLYAPVVLDLAFALRPAVERAINMTRHAGAYADHKSKSLEEDARRLLGLLTRPDQAYRSLRTGQAKAHDPEHDALLRIDSVALAAEVKGGNISPSARHGSRDAQNTVFARLINDGARQATNLIHALRRDGDVTGVRTSDDVRETVDLGPVDVWIPLVITLEDVSGPVAAGPAAFPERDPHDPYPIVLTLDDLEWCRQTLKLPAQFVHYLVVRQQLAEIDSSVSVHDEVDWFRFYCAGGGHAVRSAVTELAEIEVPIVIQTTDRRRGVPDPRAPVWQSPFHVSLERWERERRDGWLEASLAVLDLPDETAADLIAQLAARAAELAAIDETWAFASCLLERGGRALHIALIAGDNPPTREETVSALRLLQPTAREHILAAAWVDSPEELHFQTWLALAAPAEAEPGRAAPIDEGRAG